MRRELNWKIITEKYLFSLFTEHHSDDLKCQSRVDTTIHPPQLTRAFEGLGGGAGPTSSPARVGSVWLHPNEGWGRRMKITTEWRGGGERKGGCKKKNRKENGRGSSCYQVHFQSSLCCLLSHNAHTSTHTHVFTGLVWWGTSTGQQRDAQGGLTHCSQDSITYHRRPVSGTLNSFLTSAGN